MISKTSICTVMVFICILLFHYNLPNYHDEHTLESYITPTSFHSEPSFSSQAHLMHPHKDPQSRSV